MSRNLSSSLFAAALAALLSISVTGTAEACIRAMPAGAGAPVPADQAALNTALLDAAILAEVNHTRCRSGLRPLTDAPSLRPVAEAHARWMARTATLTHAPALQGGLDSLGARLAAGGYGSRAGAENIAMVHRYQIDGQPVFVRNAGACHFTNRRGQPIGAHSYASLAAHLVAQWMASPGHRTNLLHPRLTRVAHAGAVAPHRASCGRVYAVQIFAG